MLREKEDSELPQFTLLTKMRCAVCQVAQLCPTLQPYGLQPTGLLRPWNSPDKNTGVGGLLEPEHQVQTNEVHSPLWTQRLCLSPGMLKVGGWGGGSSLWS